MKINNKDMNAILKRENNIKTELQEAGKSAHAHFPKVSVCMSMYNASKYLRECIDSVLAQTFEDFEFLIVDDGSVDNSVEIVNSYCDNRIRLIKNTHDYIGSLNILLSEARGKYIVRMDADDVMMLNRLQVQLDYMDSHESTGILAMSAILLDTEEPVCDYSDCMVVSKQDLLYANPIIHSTTCIRTSILKKHNLKYEESFKYAEDYRLWTVCAMHHVNMEILPYVGIKYRNTPGQISQNLPYYVKKAASRVKLSYARWLCRQSNISYSKPRIKKTNKLLTVIIPFLNEGYEVVETVKSLRDNVSDKIDIIIINDFSTDELDYQSMLSKYNVYYVLNKKRLGVAASRNLGVELCSTPYFLLLDAHMRVYNGKWLKDITDLLKKDDRQLLCAQTKQLWKDDHGKIEELKDVAPVYGAYATFDKGYLSPGIEWNYIQRDESEKLQPIACVLGAGYAASKRYWQYLRGLEGLKLYGCDEVYISLKVWSEGGKCILLKEHSFGHIYRNKAPYQIPQCSFVYNYLMVAYVLFPVVVWCWVLSCCQIARPDEFQEAWSLFMHNKKKLNSLKQYHSAILNMPLYNVLKINQLIAKQSIKNPVERLNIAEQISMSILQHTKSNYGIVDGKMAALIWLALWDKDGKKQTLQLRQELYEEIKNSIYSRLLPFNFRNGLCGIAWGLFYLYANKLLGDIDESLLNQIDLDIQSIEVNRFADKSLYYGSAGVLVYIVCRELYNKHKGLSSIYTSHFTSSLISESKWLIKKSKEHMAVYYSYIYKHIKYVHLFDDFIPQLDDWITFPVVNPHNPQYWSYSMDSGCLGYTVPLLKK